jgi:integrase
MPRAIRSTTLESRTNRLRLPVRKKPFSIRIARGIRLGYRRNETGGTWSVIATDGHGNSWMKRFATADDHEEADGRNVLTFWQAQKQARELARGNADSDPNAPSTVKAALASYRRELEGRGQPTTFVRRFERTLPSAMLAKPVALLNAKELAAVRDEWAVRCKPISVNRMGSVLKAALNHAAAHDERIASSKAWAIGLKSFRDAYTPRNTILSDDQVRSVIEASYRLGDSFGLLIEVLAVTGARCSQAARLDVGDLRLAGLQSSVLMPSSAKGRSVRARNPVPLPLPPGLAARLARAAHGQPADAPLITTVKGGRWNSLMMGKPFAEAVAAAGLDPRQVTGYALRHSAITREIAAGVPIRIIAASHDTSVAMIERTYSKHVANHSDELLRKVMLDVDQGKVSALRR